MESNSFLFPTTEIVAIRLFAEWYTHSKGVVGHQHESESDICDLDLKLFLYDDKARMIERLDGDATVSSDGSIELTSDIAATDVSESYIELAKANLDKIDKSVEAIILFLDGGVKNYSMVNRVKFTCRHTPGDRTDIKSSGVNENLLTSTYESDDLCEGIVLAALYRVYDKKNRRSPPRWKLTAIFEESTHASLKNKYDLSTLMVTTVVPSLTRYRPRVFSSVR